MAAAHLEVVHVLRLYGQHGLGHQGDAEQGSAEVFAKFTRNEAASGPRWLSVAHFNSGEERLGREILDFFSSLSSSS
jgi:hypothetical protein